MTPPQVWGTPGQLAKRLVPDVVAKSSQNLKMQHNPPPEPQSCKFCRNQKQFKLLTGVSHSLNWPASRCLPKWTTSQRVPLAAMSVAAVIA